MRKTFVIVSRGLNQRYPDEKRQLYFNWNTLFRHKVTRSRELLNTSIKLRL